MSLYFLPFNMKLKTREECDTYLSHVCRHHCSRENPVQKWNVRYSFSQPLWFLSAVDGCSLSLQLVKTTVFAESCILYFIFSLGSLYYSDVYTRESGRCRTIPFFLTFFLSFHLFRFSFCINIIYQEITLLFVVKSYLLILYLFS